MIDHLLHSELQTYNQYCRQLMMIDFYVYFLIILLHTFFSSASLECNTCKKSYKGNGTYLDLIVTSGSEEYTESVPPSTELFR